MKNNAIFGMGIFHTANGLKVLRQAKISVRQMSRGDSFGCVIFKILWDNGAKAQPRQNTVRGRSNEGSQLMFIWINIYCHYIILTTLSYREHSSAVDKKR